MGRKHLKFITIPEALEKLKNTMMMQSEVQQQEEIEPILAQIEDFEAVKLIGLLGKIHRLMCSTFST
jgi:hypothetical protein